MTDPSNSGQPAEAAQEHVRCYCVEQPGDEICPVHTPEWYPDTAGREPVAPDTPTSPLAADPAPARGTGTTGQQTSADEDEDDCPHCSPRHGNPATRNWGVRVGDERDSDRQPTHLRVEITDGSHVAPADARWLWQLIRTVQTGGPQTASDGELDERRTPRPFALLRHTDVTGVSGAGVVAEGVEFADGSAALRWLSDWPTSVVFHDRGIASIEHVHGHSGATEIVWMDEAQDSDPLRAELTRLREENEAAPILLRTARRAANRWEQQAAAERALVEHYRRRADMTPSERQSILGETVDQSRQPEAGWIALTTRHVADTLVDNGSYGWWTEQATQHGLDSAAVLEIAQALAATLQEQGRPFDARTLAELRSAAKEVRTDG